MANGIVLNIDTTKSEFQNPMVQLRQGDGNYQSLSVTVTSNGEPFDLTGWTTTFMGTTAGGFKIVDSAVNVNNALQGSFTYTPTKAWGQDQGEFKNAYFKFTKANETASGASFRVNVLDAVDLTAEEAGDYISVVDTLIDDVKTSMDTKLAETKQTLADTQSQANTVQTNVDELNTNVNDLKAQNNNIKTTDNTWSGTNTFTKPINSDITGKAANASHADSATKSDTATSAETANDPNAVKLNGNQTITGENTFTGLTTFSQPINGVNKRINVDNNANINDFLYTGEYIINGPYGVANYPSGANNYGYLHVEWVNNTTTIQTIRTVDLTTYIRSYSGTNPVWSAWKKIVPQSL